MEQHAISSDLIRGHIDTIILHTLLSGDKFAQQISEAIEEKSGGEYKINQATLYSSLKRLESLKHVSSYWFDSVSGRRKYFKLTDLGKENVESNLSSWSYSRAIIDKLMDCAQQPIYKVEYVEKIVSTPVTESPVNNFVEKIEQQTLNTEQLTEIKDEKQETISESASEVYQSTLKTEDTQNKQEINFRNILNGLIKSTVVQPAKNEKESVNLETLQKTETETPIEQTEKLKFNDTITNINYNEQKSNNNGKIDFGDLSLKAAKEGYKIRISSKDSVITEGTLFINKLNAFSSVALLFLMVAELIFFTIKFNDLLNFNFVKVALISVFILIYPTITIIKYLNKPERKSSKKIHADIILTSAIALFNLSLITFAANLIAGVNFSNIESILASFVLPIVVYLDVFAYFVIKYFLAKLDYYYIKRK